MIERPLYMKRLMAWKDAPEIKVLTGVRRSGKSVLLDLFADGLRREGVGAAHILRINMESLPWRSIRTQTELYDAVAAQIPARGKSYLLMDEPQSVEGWEDAVMLLREEWELDIYLSGSQAQILSEAFRAISEGHYAELHVLPLSFKEFQTACPFPDGMELPQRFDAYLTFGGMPALARHPFDEARCMEALADAVSSAVMQDIFARNRISDPLAIERLMRCLAESLGSSVSWNAIAKRMGQGKPLAVKTAESYGKMARDAYLFYEVPIFDIRGKRHFQRMAKRYIPDPGICTMLFGASAGNRLGLLRNMVFLELLRLGVQVSAGRINEQEVDFIATWGKEKIYIQVAETLQEEAERERVLPPLRSIPDQHAKWVLSLDENPTGTEDGIRISNLLEFLMDE